MRRTAKLFFTYCVIVLSMLVNDSVLAASPLLRLRVGTLQSAVIARHYGSPRTRIFSTNTVWTWNLYISLVPPLRFPRC